MPKNKKPVGKALVKAKKIKRFENLKIKNETDGSIETKGSSNLDCKMVESKTSTPVANSLSHGDSFLGFSPQSPDKRDRKTVENGFNVHTFSISDDEEFLGFTPERNPTCERKLVGSELSFISGNKAAMTPIASHGNSVEINENLVQHERNSQDVEIRDCSFFKIVTGDFCQFSPKFPYPQHQCTAMAATALAYNVLKPIAEWNANDLNAILNAGQPYFEECMYNLQLTVPTNDSTFLEALSLNENLSIASQNMEVFVEMDECRGGPYESREFLADALSYFENNDLRNLVLTYKEYSYGLLRQLNSYIFFDSHGRNEKGEKVIHIPGNDEGKSAILFFENADNFIDFFVQEWELLPSITSGLYSDLRNFIFVPLQIVKRSSAENAPLLMLDPPEIGSSQTEEEINFRIVCGAFCEYDLKPAKCFHHQCSGIVIFSFIYSTLHTITEWNSESFTDILSFGNQFYQGRYDQQVQNNSQYDKTSIMYPRQLSCHCSYANFVYEIHVSELDFPGRMTKEDILDGLTHLENLEILYGIFVVDNLSYGITVCGNENESCYIFFDSHGRTNTGASNGPYSATLYFDNVYVFTTFIYNQFREATSFTLHPVHLSRQPVPPVPAVIKDPFKTIVCSNTIEFVTDKNSHTHCIALSMCAIFNAHQNGTENWLSGDLDDIFNIAKNYHIFCNEALTSKGVADVHGNLKEYLRDIWTDEDTSYSMSFQPIGHGTLFVLRESLRLFYNSSDYKYALLTICGLTYAICKCSESNKILFYDVHGRNSNGTKGGTLSVGIYFNTFQQLHYFLRKENEDAYLFSLECVKIALSRDEAIDQQNMLPRVISGTFAQSDLRFGGRKTQCTANSVVFLAFASVVKAQWIIEDIDAILILGDHIYTPSYREAIRLRPRNDTYLAAHEIRQNILVNINRFNQGVVNVLCKPLTEKEYSGNFGKFAKIYITRFFEKFSNGVFICSTLSVALHKLNDEYIVFDPHARTVEGKMYYKGTANIFFFKDISSLYECLCCFGYNTIGEFTLTPFEVSHDDSNNANIVIRPSINRHLQMIEISQDSMDDIPIAESPDWLPSDNIPLNQLLSPWNSSEDIPLINLVERSPSSVKSMSAVNTKSKADRYRDRSRSQVKSERQKNKEEQYAQFEKEVLRRWKNYIRKTQRTNIPNVFGSLEAFKKLCEKELNDNLDDELAAAADSAIANYMREEETARLRVLNKELHPTHFHAYGNHEDIDEADEMYALYKLSPMDQICPHCGALYFREECNYRKIFRTCCNFGEVHSELPQQQVNTYPQFLRDLLLQQSPMSKHFMDNIMQYNNVLSFASLGATNVHHMQARGSLGPVVAMEGMIYHVAEHFHTNSTGVDMPTAQLYYIANNAAVSERLSRVTGISLNRGLLLQLENFMRANNPLAGAYRMLKDVLDEIRRRPNAANIDIHLEIVRNRDQIRIRQNHGGDFGVPTSNEVAVVYTHHPTTATNNIVVFPVDQAPEEGITLASHDPNRDAMMYPLLFPYSEQTWSYTLKRRKREEIVEENMPDHALPSNDDENNDDQPEENEAQEDVQRKKPRVRITVREFFCYILMLRMAFSPILNAGKLGQQFIIDAYARAQDNTFEYLQSERGQAQIRAETYGALKDYIDRKKVFQPDIPGKLIVMPNDIIGSQQYMKNRYQDTLCLVAKYGKPTFFITMTCNPMWDEIQKQIPKSANPVDHPGIVARVFRAKVKEFIDDISKKHVLGKCLAYVAVIEWQKRSLPHCHLVVLISPEDKPVTSVDIPDPFKTPRLFAAVTKYMYHHRCDDTSKKESCREPRKGMFYCPRHPRMGEEEDKDMTKKCICHECSKHFPHKFVDKSELKENSYPIYRRRRNGRKFVSSRGHDIDNQWIVPYNPYFLLKYDCHINIEITSSLKSIKYLFKYLHKGLDMARLNIKIIDNVQVYNEFDHFVDCRYLSAGEAIWKLYDFPMFYQSHTIYSLPVHLENYQNVIFHQDNPAAALRHTDSMLTAYFKLNEIDPEARQYLYTDIPLHYVYDKKRKAWHRRQLRLEQTLGRMYIVNYKEVELYALRMLLLTVKGAQSFEAIRNVNGIQFDTFRQAAIELGLLQNDILHIKTFEEIINAEMPYRIRCLFVNMLLFNTPSDPAMLWKMFKKHMYDDFVHKGCSEDLAMNLTLRHLSFLLTAAGKSNTDFLLPEPNIAAQDAQQAQTMTASFDSETINQSDAAIEGQRLAQLLNNEQRCIFDEIVDSAQNPNDTSKQRLFFVDGPGGTGKTFLFSTIISTLIGLGLEVVPIAWTGIASSLLRGGRTVHSTFKLPLNMTGPVGCNLSTLSDAADKLRTARVIVWDEISMTLRYALDAVDVFFQDLMGNKLPFGGKVFVATGDFRQILPIVKGGSKYDLLNATVKKSNVWPLLQKRALLTNVRLTDPNDVAFGKWLLDVGEDKIHDFPGNTYYQSYVKLPSECIEANSIIDRIYGSTFSSSDIEHYSKYAILTTHNEDVAFLNEAIYSRLTEDVPSEETYYSTDSVIGLDPDDIDDYDISMLNSLSPPNLAPHILRLKKNCIVMLLCNLNPAEGLCNGTRLIVTKLYKTCIRAKILAGDRKGKEVLISRCRMNVDSQEVSGKVERIQIPVKLAFAMTINKSQGQTFERVGLYLRKAPFAHGHLYVALSRVRSKNNLIIQVLPDTLMGKLIPDCDDVFVPNVVYKEIF